MTTHQNHETVRMTFKAESRCEVIEKFTEWVNSFPYYHSIILGVKGIIADVPDALQDEKIHWDYFLKRLKASLQEILKFDDCI